MAWLNFANGAWQYMELLDTDNDGIVDTPFYDLMVDAEGSRNNPDTSKAEIKVLINLVHHINQISK